MRHNKLAENMRNIWNTTSPRNAHLGISGEKTMLIARYKELVTSMIDMKGKRVIDFGIGGGLLGKLLLSKYDIAYYFGYDLAERSINTAKINMVDFYNKELILLTRHVWSFAEKLPDVIVCLACIFHFPTKTYLDNFLFECNKSGAQYLVLEIRNSGKGTVFQSNPYSSIQKTLMACDTEPKYVTSKLANYNLVKSTNNLEAPTNCQILWYKRHD